MTAFRLIVQRRPVHVDLILRLVDTVVLPALGAAGERDVAVTARGRLVT